MGFGSALPPAPACCLHANVKCGRWLAQAQAEWHRVKKWARIAPSDCPRAYGRQGQVCLRPCLPPCLAGSLTAGAAAALQSAAAVRAFCRPGMAVPPSSPPPLPHFCLRLLPACPPARRVHGPRRGLPDPSHTCLPGMGATHLPAWHGGHSHACLDCCWLPGAALTAAVKAMRHCLQHPCLPACPPSRCVQP